jgi:hypothetical protein
MTLSGSMPLGLSLPLHSGTRIAKGSSLLAPLTAPGSPSLMAMSAPGNDPNKPPPLWIPSSMSTPPASPLARLGAAGLGSVIIGGSSALNLSNTNDPNLLSVIQPPSPSLAPLSLPPPPLSPFSAAMRDLSLDQRALASAAASAAMGAPLNTMISSSSEPNVASNIPIPTGAHQMLERRHRKGHSGTGGVSSAQFYSPATTTPPESPVQISTSLNNANPTIATTATGEKSGPRFGKGRLVVGPSSKVTHSSRASSTWSPVVGGSIVANGSTIVAYHSSSPPMESETLEMREMRARQQRDRTQSADFTVEQALAEMYNPNLSINGDARPLSSSSSTANPAGLSIATSPNTSTPGSRAHLPPPPAGGRAPIDVRDRDE